MDNPDFYVWTGIIAFALIVGLYKKLRNTFYSFPVVIFSLSLAILGILHYDNPSLQLAKGSAVQFALLPLLFLIYFSISRKIYILLFAKEPLMTAPYQFSWDQGEYRKLNNADFIFTILTIFSPVLTSSYILKLIIKIHQSAL